MMIVRLRPLSSTCLMLTLSTSWRANDRVLGGYSGAVTHRAEPAAYEHAGMPEAIGAEPCEIDLGAL